MNQITKFLVLGLGNELLGDDAVGIRVAQQLHGAFPPEEVEVRWTSSFGLALLDELVDREEVLLIDSYVAEPGAEIQEWDLDGLDTAGAGAAAPCPHFFGLSEVRDVMRSLGLGYPRKVYILAIPVADPFTFSTQMSGPVTARVEQAVERARQCLARSLLCPLKDMNGIAVF